MRKSIVVAMCLLFSVSAHADVRCSGTPCIDSTGGFSSPVTNDPVIANGAWTFDKLVSATLGVAAPSAAGANSVEIGTTAGALTFGGTADAFELKVTATDPTFDKTIAFPEYGTPAFGGEVVLGDSANSVVNFFRWPSISNIDAIYGPHGGGSWRTGWAPTQTVPSAMFNVETGSGILLVTEYNDQNFNYAVPAQTDPMLVMASHNQSVDERMGIGHNGTQPIIADKANTAGATRPVRLVGATGLTVASATTVTPTGNVFHVSGTTNIDTVTIMGAGTMITMIFDGILTVSDLGGGGNVNLSAAFVSTANDTLTLVSDGSGWFEAGRSAN